MVGNQSGNAVVQLLETNGSFKLLPFEPTEMVDALNSNKKNKLFKNVHSLHFFPLGGIEASAAFAKNIGTPA